MSEQFLSDLLREAPKHRHHAWARWERNLKPWAIPATVTASIGVILLILSDSPGLGLALLWVAVPVLVIGAGAER